MKRGPRGKVQRNANLLRYHAEHPNVGPAAIGRIFKISKQRAAAIIKRAREQAADENNV